MKNLANVEQFYIQGVEIILDLSEEVFSPSKNGSFYADNISLKSNERIIDIGTGTGILAIYGAKLGANVCATDVSPVAVDQAIKNAHLNQVSFDTQLGPLFADFAGPFDVILANLPNEIIPPAYIQQVGQKRTDLFDGKEGGHQALLELLEAAPDYMHQASRLYFPVHTLTDYHKAMGLFLQRYDARLLAIGELPAKPFVTDHIEFYKKLANDGVIRLYQKEGRWYTTGYIFELRLKS